MTAANRWLSDESGSSYGACHRCQSVTFGPYLSYGNDMPLLGRRRSSSNGRT